MLTKEGKKQYKTPPLVSVIVMRKGQIAVEEYFTNPRGAFDEEIKSGPQMSNNIHSASKTLLALAMGLALQENKGKYNLNTPLHKIFPDSFRPVFEKDKKKMKLTLAHLLRMEGGLKWIEDKTEEELQKTPDWVKAILDLEMIMRPGQ